MSIATSRQRIIVLFRFYSKLRTLRNFYLQSFIYELRENELLRDYVQQDSAIAHTARRIECLEQFFLNGLITRETWSSKWSDLTPLDFFLFSHLKNRVFSKNLNLVIELKAEIVTPNILIIVFNIITYTGELIYTLKITVYTLNFIFNFFVFIFILFSIVLLIK